MFAEFKSTRTTYQGMLLPKARVIGHPQAEVWEVFSSRGKTIASFAVSDGQIKALS